ncbi:hypothetical protein C8J57DRAFT_1505851 [Mycena rebaudengoi]|nr:hypothetical protein C8J57DRAFT_1505851 [Mycena rebaudengoi]
MTCGHSLSSPARPPNPPPLPTLPAELPSKAPMGNHKEAPISGLVAGGKLLDNAPGCSARERRFPRRPRSLVETRSGPSQTLPVPLLRSKLLLRRCPPPRLGSKSWHISSPDINTH